MVTGVSMRYFTFYNKPFSLEFLAFFLMNLFLASTSYALNLDKIIVFGDSLSDTGNVFAFTTKAHQFDPDIPIVPAEPPYYAGRFTNGWVWIEYIAQRKHLPLMNYAYGGAWGEPTLDSKQTFPFGLDMQVNFYLADHWQDNKAKHLYVIWIGANDYIPGRMNIDYATTNTIKTIKQQIDWLVFNGARNFLILNLPNLGKIPETVQQGSDKMNQLSELSSVHNKKLLNMLEQARATYPNAKFLLLDIASYFELLMQHPLEYQLKNITQACYTGLFKADLANPKEMHAAEQNNISLMNNFGLRTAYYAAQLTRLGQQPCVNPDDYLFWDSIHPTRVVHHLISGLALNLIDKTA